MYGTTRKGIEEVENLCWDFGKGVDISFKSDSVDVKKLLQFYSEYEGNEAVEKTIYAFVNQRNSHGETISYVETESFKPEGELAKLVFTDERIEDLERLIKALIEDEAMKEAYQIGKEEFDYQYSNECLKEDIKANGFEFTKDGKVW